MILNQHNIIFRMSPISALSDKIDIPLYDGIFYIFGKLRGILGEGGKYRYTNKLFAPKVFFEAVHQLIGGFCPIPSVPISPPPLLTAPKVPMLLIGNIWQ